MDPESIDLTLHVFRDLVCFPLYNVPNNRTLGLGSSAREGASGTSNRSPGLANRRAAAALADRSRVPRRQSAAGAPYTARGGQHLRPSALPQRCFRCITRLTHSQVRCRASSDTVPSLAVDGFMSVCHQSPTADKARQHPREGAWCMHGWASMIRCDPVR